MKNTVKGLPHKALCDITRKSDFFLTSVCGSSHCEVQYGTNDTQKPACTLKKDLFYLHLILLTAFLSKIFLVFILHTTLNLYWFVSV